MKEVVKRPPMMSADAFFGGNDNKQAFAKTTFASTKEAQRFLNELELHGAGNFTLLGVRHEAWRYKQDGGPYADMLVFTVLPDKRRKVLNYLRRVGKPGAILAMGTDQYLVWWPPKRNAGAAP